MVRLVWPAQGVVWRVAIAFALVMAFVGGYRLSAYFQSKVIVSAAGVPPTDFAVPLPEGETRITITDPQQNNAQLASFVVKREGNSFKGVPESERVIEARSALSFEDIAFFRRELTGVNQITESDWQRAVRIRNWLTTGRHKVALPGLSTRTPREAYVQMRQGKAVLCGNLADIYVALCESAGLIARTVNLSLMVRDGTFGTDTHAGAETWLPEVGGWVYQDPTFNCYWTINGRPASALQLHKALMTGAEIEPVAANARAESMLKEYYIDPRLLFRHISYEYKSGGSLLYYVDGRMEPLNMRDRNWLQSDESTTFERLDQNGNRFVERKGEVAPGIFVQLIGNVLFVRDRREQNRGIRVRSSTGAVQACSYEHWRAQELGVFVGKNLARNGSFELTEIGEGIANEWMISGPVEAVTTLGGQGIGAQAGGKLSQRIVVEPGKRYLMYAKLSVSRGMVTWSLADAVKGMESHGIVRPTQMTEVVSDVVEAHSGYLDVSFALSEAGGFRVMNVIVTELGPNAVQQMQRSVPVIDSVARRE